MPPVGDAMARDVVHLWHLPMPLAQEAVCQLEPLLTLDERQRADRFFFPRDRQRYVGVRGVLRVLLGHYLGMPPCDVRLQIESYGKPAVVNAPADKRRLCFNVSHTDGLSLIVCGWERELGVDVERIRPVPEYEQIAERYFAPGETAALARLPLEERLEGFFACWTRKEAFLKAQGEGLARPLDSFEVSLAAAEPARLISISGEPDGPTHWQVIPLAPAAGYVGAVVGQGQDWIIDLRTAPDLSEY